MIVVPPEPGALHSASGWWKVTQERGGYWTTDWDNDGNLLRKVESTARDVAQFQLRGGWS